MIATIGSLGDLHPCLALALGLRQRGHRPVIATTELYRAKVTGLDLDFEPMRPNIPARDERLIREVMDMRRGPEFLLRQLILPALGDTVEDLLTIAAGADLLIAGEIVFAAPLVAEKLGIPWISAILSPFSFLSACDPSVLPFAPSLGFLRNAGRPLNRVLLELGRMGIHHWWEPVRRLRAQLGLSAGRNPLFYDKFSGDLTLALFSPELARPQPDWPPNTTQTGFVYYDRDEAGAGMAANLADFLDRGDPPIVFTLGSTAVHDPRGFFEESAAAANAVGRRAVFLIGENDPPAALSQPSLAVPYAPHSEVFPRAAVIVHQGGVGTTAQALRSGRPSLIMPCGFDQPDNAARVQRLGVGLTLSRSRYRAATAAGALKQLISDPSFAGKAETIGRRLRSERGLESACAAVERFLAERV